MKSTYSFLIVIFISTIGYSQTIYYDALKLKSKVDEDLGNKIILFKEQKQLLMQYFPGKTEDNVDTGLLNQNPFLKGLFVPKALQSDISAQFKSLSLSSIGNLDVTNVADGLARFLIKRGKEELNIAFFERMKDFLDQNEEARTLFPATSSFLGSIASYRYSELLQSLREAFYKDIQNVIVNLNELINLPKYQYLLRALPEIRIAVRSAKVVSELSQSGSSLHPANLINHLAGLKEWGEMNSNLENTWKLLNLISQSVRKDTAADRKVGWISFSDFHDNILDDNISIRIYLGLLYQQAATDKISFRIGNDNIAVATFMKDHADDFLSMIDWTENFLYLANDVDQTIQDFISARQDKTLSDNDYYSYIEKAINLVEYGFRLANVIRPGIEEDRYIIMARNANDLYKNIYTKNYNAAVMNAYQILTEIMAKSREATAEKMDYYKSAATSNLNSSQIEEFRKDTMQFSQNLSLLNKQNFFHADSVSERESAVEKILKYGNAIAGIVKAESPEEAEAAIEAAALPAGSSSIKKNAQWNISLNAYIGGYITNSLNNTDKIDGANSNIGVTAPVGIAFNKGLWHFKNGASAGSLSAYLTLVDVGAIAGYRLNNDSTALEQKVTIEDIFTPGAYLVYGFGLFKFMQYVPLSVGYGWQYGSKLYYRTDNGKLDVSDQSRWRPNWFIAIDIPIANFWTKNRRKQP